VKRGDVGGCVRGRGDEEGRMMRVGGERGKRETRRRRGAEGKKEEARRRWDRNEGRRGKEKGWRERER
jgi:hypothetical protein